MWEGYISSSVIHALKGHMAGAYFCFTIMKQFFFSSTSLLINFDELNINFVWPHSLCFFVCFFPKNEVTKTK